MRYVYCPQCGKKLIGRHAGDDGDVPYCEDCRKFWFDSFASCIIVLTYNEFDEMVLCRQGYLSDKYTSLTAGYITPGENAEQCALREVKEELGIELEDLQYGGTYWFPKGDMLMHAFIGYAHKQPLTLSEEVDWADWVHPSEAARTFFPDSPSNAAWGLLRQFTKMRNISLE